jgi:hypothetical protein
MTMYCTFEDHRPEDKTAMDCRVWVATVWLLRAGTCFWDVICGTKQENTETGGKTKVYKLLLYLAGPLCDGVPEQGVPRWDFWKSRLLEFAKNWDHFFSEGADTTRERIMKTVQHMDSVKQICW